MRKLEVALAMMAITATAGCGTSGGGAGGDDGGRATSVISAVALPQSSSGAMWVDPDAYPVIPVHVAVSGAAASVAVIVDGVAIDAAEDAAGDSGSGSGSIGWTALVSVANASDGMHVVDANATDADGNVVGASAALGVGRAGIQWTDFGADLVASTPRLHRVGDQLVITWSDISSGTRVDWLQAIDGAGRALAGRVPLLGGANQPDILYARTVVGAASIGVMYQERGDPYVDYFTIVDVTGAQTIAPIALDPDGRVGSWGGDVAFDGTAYYVTWRTASGPGVFDVRWMSIDEKTGATVGPIAVALPGNDDPHGGFDAISNVGVRAFGDGTSAVAFSRYEYDDELQSEILRCQYAMMAADGTVTATVVGAIGSELV